MLYLLRAHCLAGWAKYFQQKNKSVDLGLIIHKTGNKIWDYKEQIWCCLLDLYCENQGVKILLQIHFSHGSRNEKYVNCNDA